MAHCSIKDTGIAESQLSWWYLVSSYEELKTGKQKVKTLAESTKLISQGQTVKAPCSKKDTGSIDPRISWLYVDKFYQELENGSLKVRISDEAFTRPNLQANFHYDGRRSWFLLSFKKYKCRYCAYLSKVERSNNHSAIYNANKGKIISIEF
ncbi:hypothetical protein MTR_1g080380 [Medicago truncatula]|uniref:Uncharacterized protein n=1 Tax=Medicago truncatula TaxID=3880 RepID=G7I6T8_MEDTR|nr:hypothetical protein MTR_1g080380 [Medicago truncatula]